jgi:hypothetical protein
MIALATGMPRAKVEGSQITLTIPSGKDSLSVALDLDQAFMLQQYLTRAGSELHLELQRRSCEAAANVIPFPKQRKRAAA